MNIIMKFFITITLLLFCCSMMGHHTDKEFDIKILDSVRKHLDDRDGW